MKRTGRYSLSGLRKLGRESGLKHDSPGPEDNAILYLTSGATGEPKMVMTTHGAVVANVHMGPKVLALTTDDITIAFLPSAHIAQRVVVEILPILSGSAVSFAESLLKLQPEIKAVRPTFFLAPPRVWERVYTSIRTEVQKKPKLAQKLFFGGLALGLAASKHKRTEGKVPFRIRVPLDLAHQGGLQQDSRPLRRAAAGGGIRRGAAGRRPGGVLRSDRHAFDRRLRARPKAALRRSIRWRLLGPAVSAKRCQAFSSRSATKANCCSRARRSRRVITRTLTRRPN